MKCVIYHYNQYNIRSRYYLCQFAQLVKYYLHILCHCCDFGCELRSPPDSRTPAVGRLNRTLSITFRHNSWRAHKYLSARPQPIADGAVRDMRVNVPTQYDSTAQTEDQYEMTYFHPLPSAMLHPMVLSWKLGRLAFRPSAMSGTSLPSVLKC